ncbi:fatty acyl-AMP ligase [Trinickia sp. LjRoot230]|uniref:fatty acyl-AMP ligase n=1 Tax=Trinickia sp. LjRoot230 TaxID=3342288 RepID=UPI003ED0F8DF
MSAFLASLDCGWPDFVRVLRHRSHTQPDDTAFVFSVDGEVESGRLSFAALDLRARAIAAWLQAAGMTGRRVLLIFPSGLEFIEAFCGCLYAAAIAVPCNAPRPNQSLARIQSIAANADASLILTTAEFMGNMRERANGEGLLQSLKWMCIEEIPNFIASKWSEPSINGDSVAFLQYTSGSTNSPKGVVISHANLLHNLSAIERAFENSSNTVGAGWLPLFHDMGLIGNVLQPLYLGICCVLMPPMSFLQRPIRWLRMIMRFGATTSGGPNFAYDLCVRKTTPEQRAQLDLSGWDLAFCGAEPVRADTLERFARAFEPSGFRREAFYPCYGMAESTLLAAGGKKGRLVQVHVDRRLLELRRAVAAARASSDTQTLVGCGCAPAGHAIEIVDPQTRQRCAAGTVGEIWIAGPSVARGYWNRAQESASGFDAYMDDLAAGPFLRTGDLGFMHGDDLFVWGRLKDLVVIRGRNHAPEDIELTMVQTDVALVPGGGAAFSVDVRDEERLVVVHEVERAAARHLDLAALATRIRRAIAQQHDLQPHAIALVRAGSMPRTSSGKIQRYECRRRFLLEVLDVLAVDRIDAAPAFPETLSAAAAEH